MSTEPSSLTARTRPIPLRPTIGREFVGRLPVPVSTLVGRERDVAALAELLTDPTVRLATLTGPGGVGKTRLALAAAAAVADDFTDGAAFVDLSPVRNADHVVPAIVQALSIRPRDDQVAEAAVEDVLRDREVLLVLDNFEQVVAAGPKVTDLLRSCASLKVLVTSRTLLHVSGERAVPVLSLSLPGTRRGSEQASRDATDARTLGSDAVRLFVERMRDVQPGFALTDANANDVAEICRRLDGLPLAIELAAARGQLFRPAALLARLDPRLPQLAHGPRDLPERLRTMRNAIAWSYDLLTPDEQAVFRCLGTFVGGCTLEAAEAVCGSFPALDVVGAIESLVQQSLVRVVDSPDDVTAGYPRLTMLEMVREFALERLEENNETDVWRRHAEYFQALAIQMERTIVGGGTSDVHEIMRSEAGNLRAAVGRAIDEGAADLALRLAQTLVDSQPHSGITAREQMPWLRRALELPGGSPEARVRTLLRLASVVGVDDLAEAISLIEGALALAREHGDVFGTADASRILGAFLTNTPDIGRARRLLLDALAEFRTLGTPRQIAATLHHLSVLEGIGPHADFARAATYCREALAIYRNIDFTGGIEAVLNWDAVLAYNLGDLPRSLASVREALAMPRSDLWSVTALDRIADVAAAADRPEAAARLYGAADKQRDQVGWQVEPAFIAAHLAKIDIARQALGEAAFDAAYAAGHSLTQRQAEAEALAFALPDPGSSISLTMREAELLPLLAAGLSNPEIAETLFLSVRTVERHVAGLFTTLGVHTRTDAVQAARAAGLLPAPSADDAASTVPDTGA